MERGPQFLKRQVNTALLHHRAFLSALEAHEDQAEDDRFRDLCSRHIPQLREHQRMLEEYQSQLGEEGEAGNRILGAMLGAARELADSARESDFARLVADIAMARQAEDTFKTFREAGKMMGYRTLHEIGDIGERHHQAYVKEANRLVQHMFVETVQGVDRAARPSVAPDLEASAP
ncbi:MAG: hypothetical protein QOK07_1327 [Gemmatimonadaceae bacterium]|jgi:hypothetical protein|nr:hypothetical protein [Gemmatimonadaceae bacterium]